MFEGLWSICGTINYESNSLIVIQPRLFPNANIAGFDTAILGLEVSFDFVKGTRNNLLRSVINFDESVEKNITKTY